MSPKQPKIENSCMRKIAQIFVCFSESRNFIIHALSRAVISGGEHPWNLGVPLALFKPEGADYAHHISASTPGIKNLTTSLLSAKPKCFCLHIHYKKCSVGYTE